MHCSLVLEHSSASYFASISVSLAHKGATTYLVCENKLQELIILGNIRYIHRSILFYFL